MDEPMKLCWGNEDDREHWAKGVNWFIRKRGRAPMTIDAHVIYVQLFPIRL